MRAKQPSSGPAGAVLGSAGAREQSWLFWGLSTALLAAAFCVVFWDGLLFMAEHWDTEEYSHGSLIPIIAAFLIWQKKDALEAVLRDSAGQGAAAGFGVVLLGLLLGLLGELSTVYLIIQYGFLVVIGGLALVLVGWRGIFLIWAPLVYLIFMVPLPSFLYANLSAELQLISSQLGVAVIRAFDIPVFLEGNVIDLGIYKLQVVEACSGLRYLFPLMSFGFLCAYLYRGPVWHRAVLFLSTVPITILMNSIRIGVIGVLVDRWGIEQAEGALHLFEGWVVFMACVAILFGEILILSRFNRAAEGSLRNVFRIDLPDLQRGWLPRGGGISPRIWVASVALLTIAASASVLLLGRANTLPARESLAAFPLRVDDWYGQRRTIEPGILGTLKLTDYLLRDYIAPGEPAGINLYIAYYASQRKGEAVHSPRSCIPGDGWRIESLSKVAVDDLPNASGRMIVNRAIIAKGNLRQVVYYWFDQRGREMTNEYRVKWFLFWDGLTRNRTDGALIRLVTPIQRDETPASADKRLAGFVREIYPKLERYVPS